MKAERLRAGLIYGGGDLAATLLTGQFNPWRSLGMLTVGALIYAPEIRWYFARLEQRFPPPLSPGRQALRAVLAWLWFNPLWIARHALFIRLFSGRIAEISPALLHTGLLSFAVNMPVALTANFLIQNRVPFHWRVTASAAFSALMAVYYALSEVWFG